MCLENILPIPQKYQTGEHVGYKVIVKFNNNYRPPIWGWDLQLDEWNIDNPYGYLKQHDRSGCVDFCDLKTYRKGFHIFINQKDAIKWAKSMTIGGKNAYISTVLFRNVVAYGTSECKNFDQSNCFKNYSTTKVIVAREIFLKSNSFVNI